MYISIFIFLFTARARATAKDKLGDLITTVDSPEFENESPLKFKITIESTKTVDEKEMLERIYSKLQDISESRPNIDRTLPSTSGLSFGPYPSLSSLEKEILSVISNNGPLSDTKLWEIIGLNPRIIKASAATLIARKFMARYKEEYVLTVSGRNYLAHN